ncbi:hypothetical protein BGX21_002188 [Mortierella sp. AD011]|nr:hypothetical protein BGX20_000044 [Mortierella sp. AD010]KAF9401277.1 hypothetical protein BGX21_002188 [Mortierella sp. AD011]
MIFSKSFSFLSTYLLLLQLLALSSQHNLVQAGEYSFQTPTSATRWVTGQVGQVTINSQDKATSATPTNDHLLTITLRYYKNILQPDALAATIKDNVQLLVPYGSTATQVSMTINDFIVPTTLAAGTQYFVRILRYNNIFDQESDDSPYFQIVSGAITTTVPAGNATTATLFPTTTALPTTTIAVNTTTTSTPTPTASTQTCADVQEQCAAQGKVFISATTTAPCSCGAALIVPTIVGSGASSNIQSTTSGPTAALVVLLLVVMTLF